MTKDKTPLKWKFKTGGSVDSSPGITNVVPLSAYDVTRIAVVDGVVYFGSYDKHLYALDTKTGEEQWKFKTGDCVSSSPAQVIFIIHIK